MMRVEILQVGRRLDAQRGFVLHLGRMRVYSSPRISRWKKGEAMKRRQQQKLYEWIN